MLKFISCDKQMRYSHYYARFLNWFKKRYYNAKKNVAPIVNPFMSNRSVKLNKTSGDFDAKPAEKRLSGKVRSSKNIRNSAGFNFGSKKATPSDNFRAFRVTAGISWGVLKTIGLTVYPRSTSTIAGSNTSFLMAPTFTKKAVS